MISFYIVTLLALAQSQQISTEKILNLEEGSDTTLEDDLLNSYREFAAAEIVLSKLSEDEKIECNKQKRLYVDTLAEIFRQKGADISEYSGVKVKFENKPLPIVQARDTNCKETINFEFCEQHIKDFVQNNLGAVSLDKSPEEIITRLKGLQQFQTLQNNVESFQQSEIIQNALNNQHIQTTKEAVASTSQQVQAMRDVVTTRMLSAVEYFKSKQSFGEVRDDIQTKAQLAANVVQGQIQGTSINELKENVQSKLYSTHEDVQSRLQSTTASIQGRVKSTRDIVTQRLPFGPSTNTKSSPGASTGPLTGQKS